MMDNHEQRVRQAAEETFLESLIQLENTLSMDDKTLSVMQQSISDAREHVPHHSRIHRSNLKINDESFEHFSVQEQKAFEEAAEEIEAFMQSRQCHNLPNC